MKKKISIVMSSITACAIIASLFAINAHTGQDAKVQSDVATVSNTVQTYKVPSSEALSNVETATTDATKDLQSLSNSPATTSDIKAVTANTANVNSGNNEACTTTTKAQNSNNQQTNIQSANLINNSQNAINNADCNKTTAKTNNYSALKTKLEAMLSRLSANTPTTNTTKTTTCTPATCTTDAKTTTCTPATCTTTTKTNTCTPATCTTAKKPTTNKSANNTSTTKPTTNTPVAKPATSTSTNGDYSAFQNKVLELVNVERAKNGLKPLTMNANLNKTATLKSQDMAKLNYFSHTSPTYGSPFDMMKKYGISYRTAGENIAMGQTTPEQVMQGWMNSSGHRANILNSSFTQLGVGVAKNSNGQLYWTQQFIG